MGGAKGNLFVERDYRSYAGAQKELTGEFHSSKLQQVTSGEGMNAARAEAEHAAEEAELAVKASIKAFQDAEAYLEKVKLECKGAGKGKLWWLDRELEEAKKYMSQAQLARLAAQS